MVIIGKRQISLDDFNRVLYKNEKIKLDKSALDNLERGFKFIDEFSKDKVIYGISTGFGPMAQYRINRKHQIELQYNLIRSHCSGSGDRLSDIYVRSLMLARLNTLLQGYSGVHVSAALLIEKLINLEIYPVIFEHGSVGASGDLVHLAHLALVMIGEGEVSYKGKIRATSKVFEKHKITPLKAYIREGLGMINGTSATSGIGMINVIQAKNLLSWAVMASTMLNEIVECYDDHFSKGLNQVKHHVGQNKVAATMRSIVKGSKLIRQRSEHLYDKKIGVNVIKEKVQEYYSVRCIPQILGPIYDTIANCQQVLINEVNSANDNPIIDHKGKNVFHGGNFHGDYVALEMDKLKICITKLSMLLERQLNYLMNEKINNILPPFVNLGRLGLNFGMQGAQFTATSTVAENQTLSFPMYVHSIPNNNDNQDIVSMGPNAALMAKKVIGNSFEVLAIEMISIVQAIDYLQFKNRLSKSSSAVYKEIRKIVPKFEQDHIKYKEIAGVKDYLLEKRLDLL